VDRFADAVAIVRCRIATKPIQLWRVGREMHRRIKRTFDARGIAIPLPHLGLYRGAGKDDNAPLLRVASSDGVPAMPSRAAAEGPISRRGVMERGHILRALIERGSDDLARALYDRLRADRVARPEAKSAPQQPSITPSWQDLAERAVRERVLTPEDAMSLAQDARGARDAPHSVGVGKRLRHANRAR
jgi:hypothetical protein